MNPHRIERLPIRPLRFPTLLAVELRKMVDTRSGRSLIAVTTAASLAVLVWKVTQSTVATEFENYSAGVTIMVAVLTPLIGLLAMTSEWTQRTASTTFTLAPRRLPVIGAKYVAALILALGAAAIGIAMAAVAVVIGGALHGSADFTDWPGDLRYAAILVVLQVTMGAAFGAAAGNSPVALSAFLLAPTLWSLLATSALASVATSLDIFDAYGRLASDRPLANITETLTAITVWVIAPTVFGLLRGLTREIK